MRSGCRGCVRAGLVAESQPASGADGPRQDAVRLADDGQEISPGDAGDAEGTL